MAPAVPHAGKSEEERGGIRGGPRQRIDRAHLAEPLQDLGPQGVGSQIGRPRATPATKLSSAVRLSMKSDRRRVEPLADDRSCRARPVVCRGDGRGRLALRIDRWPGELLSHRVSVRAWLLLVVDQEDYAGVMEKLWMKPRTLSLGRPP